MVGTAKDDDVNKAVQMVSTAPTACACLTARL